MYWQRRHTPKSEIKTKYAQAYEDALNEQKGKRSKFNSQSTYYNDVWYGSLLEANYARELDLRVRAGELREWKRQVPIDLVVNGVKICTYKIDFLEIDKNGGEMWTETKGAETAEWRIKWKLFDAIHPDWDKQVIN